MASKLQDKALWHPSLWLSWLVVFILFCLSFLSMENKQKLGTRFGKLANKKLAKRTAVAKTNIALCFPELSNEDQDQLVEDTYIACSKGLLESTHAWWRDVTPYVDKLKITGKEHLDEAQAKGTGVLLLGGHYSIFDFALPLFAYQLNKPGYMYRPNNNPVIDRMIEKGRRRHCGIQGFSKRNLPDMMNFLKDGGSVWYACDQDFGQRTKLFVPFFGVETGNITMPSKIARDSGASVICVSHLRHANGQYEITFSPIQKGFGEDEVADAQCWNTYLESAVRQYPDQYLWLHKRFKTRPEGAEKVY